MPSIGKAIQDLAGKNNFLEHLNELLAQSLATYGLRGVNTEIVFTIYDSEGKGLAIVIKNGIAINDPTQMGTIAERAANKTKMFACSLARAR